MRPDAETESAFRFLLRQFQCFLVAADSLLGLIKPAEQISPGCVQQVIAFQFLAVHQPVDGLQAGLRAIEHGNGDGPIEFHHR